MKHIKRKDIMYLLTCTCLVVFAWIIFTLYHASVTSTINETLTGQIEPIKPDFNTAVIEHLKTREAIIPVYELKGSKNASSSAATATISIPALQTGIIPSSTSIQPAATISGQKQL